MPAKKAPKTEAVTAEAEVEVPKQDAEELVPVRVIQFKDKDFAFKAIGIDCTATLLGVHPKSGGNRQGVRGRHEIWFIPAINQFRVRWTSRSGLTVVAMIPLSASNGWVAKT